MFRNKLGLALATLFVSFCVSANEDLSFPADPCTTAWETLKKEDYLYHPNHHQTYFQYLEKLKQLGIDRTQCHKTWTVIIDMSVTEDLAPYAIADLLEMESNLAGSSLRTDVLVQLNRISTRESQRFHLFEMTETPALPLTKNEVSHLSEGNIRSPVISTTTSKPGETDSQRFENFLRWAMAEYPSEHYLVIVWGHGQSWSGVSTFNSPGVRGKGASKTPLDRNRKVISPSQSTTLDLPSIRSVLRSIKKWRGDAIEVFASDTCLMQSMEDVAELSSCSQFICGSEAIASYAGFPYREILCELNTGNFNGAPKRVSTAERSYSEPYLTSWMITELYKESFEPETGSQGALDPLACRDLTECAVSTKHIRSTLIPALNHLGNALLQFIEEKQDRWMDIRFAISRGSFFRGGTQDLGAFLKRLEKVALEEQATPATLLLRKTISRSYQALEYSIVNYALGENYRNSPTQQGARGLSIWLPKTSDEYQSRIHEFANSQFYQQANSELSQGWSTWMRRMYPLH
jgi:hypothetical protein